MNIHITRQGRLAAGLSALLTLAVLAVAPPARADHHEEASVIPTAPFEVGVFAGGRFYEKEHILGRSELDRTFKSPDHGGAFGLRLAWNLNKWFGVEAEGMISPTRTRDDSTSMIVLGYRAHAIFTFWHHRFFQPFALGGIGGYSSFPGDTALVRRDTDAMLHAGLGAKIPLNERFGLRLDGRIVVPGAIINEVIEFSDERGWEGPDFEILGSVYAMLGAPEKKAPPPPPPPPLPPPPPPPPPPADDDGDGLAGEADKCPNEAEDKDGFEDDDGCPEPDNDGDGVSDVNDKCPNQPENKNNVEDDDGCPEEDTDGDGFLGPADKCPDSPETKNGFQDDDGCPDEVPAEVKKFTGVIEGITFKTGSAEILKGSYALLDRAVDLLKEYPTLRLEIGGHTDDSGSADFNRNLSQRRADSVRSYMVARGVPGERVTAMGYGEDAPIADNKTTDGRSKNRRTEFKLLSN